MQQIKPGIYDDLSNHDYHLDPALGSSRIRLVRDETPLGYDHKIRTIETETDPLLFGSAFHLALLQPDKFNDSVAIQPESIKVRRGKAWDEFLSENRGKIIIRKEHDKYGFNILAGMIESLERPQHTTARNILRMADRICEQSIFWEDQTCGIMLKCRPDLRSPGILMVADLKSTQDASPGTRGWARIAADKGYDIQAAFYLAGVNSAFPDDWYRDFLFVCVEVAPPHHYAVYRATQEMLDTGRKKIAGALEKYQSFKDMEFLPGYADEVKPVDWPEWANNY